MLSRQFYFENLPINIIPKISNLFFRTKRNFIYGRWYSKWHGVRGKVIIFNSNHFKMNRLEVFKMTCGRSLRYFIFDIYREITFNLYDYDKWH